MHFSKWLMLHNLMSFLRDRGSDFVVGRLAGSASLGLFSVGAEISNMPGTELVAPINRAVLPAYMSIAHDLPALRREYVSVLSMVSLLAVPAVAGCAVCAPFFVLLFLGQKWMETASLIEILAFYGITRVMQSNAYSAFLALGKPQYYVTISSIHVCVLIPLLIALTRGRSARRCLGLRHFGHRRPSGRLLFHHALNAIARLRVHWCSLEADLRSSPNVSRRPYLRTSAARQCRRSRPTGRILLPRLHYHRRTDICARCHGFLDSFGPTCRCGERGH